MSRLESGTSSRSGYAAIVVLALGSCGTMCSENARRTASAPAEGEDTAVTTETPSLGRAGGATAEDVSPRSQGDAPGTPAGGGAGDREVSGAGAGPGVAAGGEGAVASPARDSGAAGVVLRAVVVPVTPDGTLGIAAEWVNATDQVIFLRGCGTADGWFLSSDGQWREHGAFALCAVETQAVEVAPGETYVDIAGAAVPPNRGTNVWRLAARYGTGCRSGELLAASECREFHEVVSVNQVRWE